MQQINIENINTHQTTFLKLRIKPRFLHNHRPIAMFKHSTLLNFNQQYTTGDNYKFQNRFTL